MAPVGKENQRVPLPLPRTPAEPGRKQSTLLVTGALSGSKIPVLSKSRHRPDLTQSPPQACSSKARSKAIGTCKISHSSPVLELAAGLSPRSLTREPLAETQLTASGCRNEGDVSHSKEVSAAEFVPDLEALASILSNTGLTNKMVSAAHKPSMAQRVPLKGKRACLASTGSAQSSLCTKAPIMNPFRMSHVSTSASKDTGHPQSRSLALNTQQPETLSTTLKNWKPGVEVAKASQPAEALDGDKCNSSVSGLEAEHLSNAAGGSQSTQSSSLGKKETTGTSWKEEEFVPDPAAKASILLNIGLSHSALGATDKVSLVQWVPLTDARKPSVICDNAQGEGAFLSQSRMSVLSGKCGRVSCHSMQGLKGLAKLDASGAQRINRPRERCSTVECSPYGLARRIPITSSQSLRRTPWSCNRVPVTSSMKDKRVKRLDRDTRQMGAIGSKEEGTTVPWEKIAVRLFDDEMAASVKKVPAVPGISTEMGKLQRIELLAQLLQQEMDGHVDYEKAPSLEELHKLLTAHCSPTPEASVPAFPSALPQDPGPSSCERAPEVTVAVPSAPGSTHTISSQLHVCPTPSLQEVSRPSSGVQNTGLAKQRLDHLLTAPLRFHEACLDEECAFYTSRLASRAQPLVHRCQEPVAKMLNAHDTVHFIPISASAPLSPPSEAERTPLS